MSNANLGRQAYMEPCTSKRASRLEGLDAILSAPTWQALCQEAQRIFDYEPGSYERNTYYSAYMVCVRDLQVRMNWLPDHKDFKIAKDDNRGNSAWYDGWH